MLPPQIAYHLHVETTNSFQLAVRSRRSMSTIKHASSLWYAPSCERARMHHDIEASNARMVARPLVGSIQRFAGTTSEGSALYSRTLLGERPLVCYRRSREDGKVIFRNDQDGNCYRLHRPASMHTGRRKALIVKDPRTGCRQTYVDKSPYKMAPSDVQLSEAVTGSGVMCRNIHATGCHAKQCCQRKSVHFRPNFSSYYSDGINEEKYNQQQRQACQNAARFTREKSELLLTDYDVRKTDATSRTHHRGDLEDLCSSNIKHRPSKRERLRYRQYRLCRWASTSDDIRCNDVFPVGDVKLNTTCSVGEGGTIVSRIRSNPNKKTARARAISNMARVQAALSTPPPDEKIGKVLKTIDSGIWCETEKDGTYSLTRLNDACDDSTPVSLNTSDLTSSLPNESGIANTSCPTRNSPTEAKNIRKIEEKNDHKSPIVACTWWQSSTNLSRTTMSEVLSSDKDSTSNILHSNQIKDEIVEDPCTSASIVNKQSQSDNSRKNANNDENTTTTKRRDDEESSSNVEAKHDLRKKNVYLNLNETNTHVPPKHEKNISKLDSDVYSRPRRRRRHSNSSRDGDEDEYNHRRRQRRRHHRRRSTTHRDHRDFDSSEDELIQNDRPRAIKSSLSEQRFYPEAYLNTKSNEIYVRTRFPGKLNDNNAACTSLCNGGGVGQSGDQYLVSNGNLYLQKPFPSQMNSAGNAGDPNNQLILYQCRCKTCLKNNLLYHSTTLPSNLKNGKVLKGIDKQPIKYDKTSKPVARHSSMNRSSAYGSTYSDFSSRGRIADMFSSCFRCFDDGSDSESSGGSDTANDDGDGDGGDGDGFVEHGDGVSVDDDSDGGDSGSESGGDVSLNSAELFDDQNNMFDIKQGMGDLDDSDGGPGSGASDCSDSLTELRSRSKKGSGTSDEEGGDDAPTEDDEEFMDSWESFAIYERE